MSARFGGVAEKFGRVLSLILARRITEAKYRWQSKTKRGMNHTKIRQKSGELRSLTCSYTAFHELIANFS